MLWSLLHEYCKQICIHRQSHHVAVILEADRFGVVYFLFDGRNGSTKSLSGAVQQVR